MSSSSASGNVSTDDPEPLDLERFANVEAITATKDPLAWTKEQRHLFVAACRELATFHHERSPEIRHIYDAAGFDPASIETEEDVLRLPFLGVTAMKHFLLLSRSEREAALQLTSSGTSGQKTQVWFDADSLRRVQSTLEVLYRQEGLISTRPTNYLMFVYNPEQARDLGIAFSLKNMQRFAPLREEAFALEKDASGVWAFDAQAFGQRARELASTGHPTRLLGMPTFLWELAQYLRGKEPVLLPEGSLALTGGGWKAAEDKRVSPEELRGLIGEVFGIPAENIRDGYGMAEHAAPYIQCRAHRFHVPVFSRVIARHPVTLEALPPGSAGLLELICPYNTMMPNLALLSTDMGVVDSSPCPCGWPAPTFSLLGRAGLTKHKGCAIAAADLVQRGS